jgi:hypothetical protein
MTDWIEIAALVTGPVLAVGLTLWREDLRQKRERKLGVMRQLLLTRSSAGDQSFTAAINLAPIEFGNSDNVMAAWESFISAANNQNITRELLDNLLKSMMLDLGYKDRAAGQVARSDYFPTALADQKKLTEGVLKGVVSVAESSRLSAHAAKVMAEHVTGKPLADTVDAQKPEPYPTAT